MTWRLVLVVLLAVLIAPAARAEAGGFGIPDIGVRRTAMGAVIGRPDEGAALYHNPAGLVMQRGWHVYVSLGVAMIRSEFQLRPWDQSDRFLDAAPGADGYYAPVRPTRARGVIPMLAVSGELLPGKLVMGAAVYVGNAQGAGFGRDAITRYHLIDGYVVAPQAVLAAAYRIRDGLTIGASVGVLHLRIHGRREVFPIVKGMDVSGITGRVASPAVATTLRQRDRTRRSSVHRGCVRSLRGCGDVRREHEPHRRSSAPDLDATLKGAEERSRVDLRFLDLEPCEQLSRGSIGLAVQPSDDARPHLLERILASAPVTPGLGLLAVSGAHFSVVPGRREALEELVKFAITMRNDVRHGSGRKTRELLLHCPDLVE